MKKLISVSLSFIMFCLLITTVPTRALAVTSDEKDNIEELLGIAGREYNTEAQPYAQEQQERNDINAIFVSNNHVILEHNGSSEFVDVIAQLKNGKYINLTNDAEWSSDNDDVVFANAGRILANAPGETNVTVEYNNYKDVINVSVLGSLDIEYEIDRLDAEHPDYPNNSLSSSDRTNAINIAKGMVNLEWTPTKNIRGWRNKTTFKAKTKYTGIPYSQTEYQKDKDGFNKALKAKDFYENYTRFDIIMPKYGSDCSGFLSFAWGLSRKNTSHFVDGIKDGTYAKVGSYNADNPSTSNLKTAYKKLQKGDAVVKSGHTFLIASNDIDNSKIYAYEQTPYNAQYTTWTYEKMANDSYMPFTKK
ncbi:hypothetical protein [Anaerocolumna sp.]|uniref:hypothetical protein n=1 Tax=Anaerocolumna sp. TaxID=2041569 RepID=UPI0028AF65F1|nr:hypothetical protein [Anaerocolumna sp.]